MIWQKFVNFAQSFSPFHVKIFVILIIPTALDTIHDKIHPRNPVYYRRTISIIESTFAIRNNRWSRRMSIYIESSQHRVQFHEFRIDDRIIEQPG